MNKKKIVSICLVLALVAVASLGTLAYFTDKEVAKNTFTIGDVDIVLDEAPVVRDEETGNYVKTDGDRTDMNTYKDIFPGQTLAKDPTITNDGPYDAYVRADMWIDNNVLAAFGCKDGNFDAFKDIFKCEGADDVMNRTYKESKVADNKIADGLLSTDGKYLLCFELGDKQTQFTVYCLDKMVKDASFTVFNTINVPATMTSEDFDLIKGYGEEGFHLDITASAIQADGFATPDLAFAALEIPTLNAAEEDVHAASYGGLDVA